MRTRRTIQRSFNFHHNSDVKEASNQYVVSRLELEHEWRKEHAEFVVAYNDTIESEGLPLHEWKSF